MSFSNMKLDLKVGWHHGNMIVTNNAFGVAGVKGFHFDPTLTRSFSAANAFGFHFQYSMPQGPNAVGLIWQRTFQSQKMLQVTADLNFMSMTIQNSSISLGGPGITFSYSGVSLDF
jgi:hypothetical protein